MMDFFQFGKQLERKAAVERNRIYAQQQDSLKEIRAKTQNLFDVKSLYAHKKEVEYILATLTNSIDGATPYREIWDKYRTALSKEVEAIVKKIEYIEAGGKKDLITDERNILTLKRAYDDILWPATDPATFLDFWRHGEKSSYLPIIKGKVNSFVYLLDLLGLIGSEKPEGLTYAALETAFKLKNLKNKAARVRNNPRAYREIKINFPQFSLKYEKGVTSR